MRVQAAGRGLHDGRVRCRAARTTEYYRSTCWNLVAAAVYEHGLSLEKYSADGMGWDASPDKSRQDAETTNQTESVFLLERQTDLLSVR